MNDEHVILLRRVIGRLARQLQASSTDEGLAPSEASVLGIVATRGPLTITELAEHERLNPTMLSRLLRKLEGANLITRVSNPADRRSSRVAITTAGWAVFDRVTAKRSSVVGESVRQLTSEQVAALAKALPALEALGDLLNRPRSR